VKSWRTNVFRIYSHARVTGLLSWAVCSSLRYSFARLILRTYNILIHHTRSATAIHINMTPSILAATLISRSVIVKMTPIYCNGVKMHETLNSPLDSLKSLAKHQFPLYTTMYPSIKHQCIKTIPSSVSASQPKLSFDNIILTPSPQALLLSKQPTEPALFLLLLLRLSLHLMVREIVAVFAYPFRVRVLLLLFRPFAEVGVQLFDAGHVDVLCLGLDHG
jgi:hypothetical protein